MEVRLDKPFPLKSFQRPFSFYFICKNHCSQTSNGLCMTDIKTLSQYIHKVTSAASLTRQKNHSKTMEVQWFSFSHPRKSSTQTLLIPLLHSDHPTVYLARSVPISLCNPNL